MYLSAPSLILLAFAFAVLFVQLFRNYYYIISMETANKVYKDEFLKYCELYWNLYYKVIKRASKERFIK